MQPINKVEYDRAINLMFGRIFNNNGKVSPSIIKWKANDKEACRWDFPGGPVVKTPRFHCRECGFDPSSGN